MPPIAISGAVEGDVDEAVLRRIVDDLGCYQGPIYGKKGKPFLRTRVNAYNAAAQFSPWLVLVDLNGDFNCPSELRNDWLPVCEQRMCFRVAVRAIESWLIADAQRFSEYFGVAMRHIPPNSESVRRPKQALVNLVRQSRRREVREDMVPRPASGRQVGPAYSSHLIEFVSDKTQGWRPTIGANSCNSLKRCLDSLKVLIEAEE